MLDMGIKIWQLNTKGSVGKERFKAAEFAQSMANERRETVQCDVQVFGEWYFILYLMAAIRA